MGKVLSLLCFSSRHTLNGGNITFRSANDFYVDGGERAKNTASHNRSTMSNRPGASSQTNLYFVFLFCGTFSNIQFFFFVFFSCVPSTLLCQILIQDPKNNVDADLVMLEELKVKCRTQTEQIMAWKKAYSMQVIEFLSLFHLLSIFFSHHIDVSQDEMKK